MKTLFGSYSLNGVPTGCKYCIRGKKLVVFISGICGRGCKYCSLSDKRKNKDVVYSNERITKNKKELIDEVIESNATSAGITGGDPLLFLKRTLGFSKTLKNKFGKKFHIHIYLPTRNVTRENLKKLSKYIDEVRFHPDFLSEDSKDFASDLAKIRLAKEFFKKENMGVELPMIPDKKEEIIKFISLLEKDIGFLNLNELEISESNFDYITNKYKLDKEGYTVLDSIKKGKEIIDYFKKKKSKLKIHLCTAETKNRFQYENRLKNHKILPFGKRTEDGTVIYLAIYESKEYPLEYLKKNIKGEKYLDMKKRRIILSLKTANKYRGELPIERVEESPTFEGDELERWKI